MTDKQKHIHIIGICGVLTSAMAGAFHKNGWKVTGSDKGFFPPVSTQLEKLGISFYAGWHPEKMIENGVPDLVVIATASGSQNPETKYVKEHNIPFASSTQVFRDYFIKKNSIVCAGTWGKTSSSALLSFILERAGKNPSYMFGGISLSHELSAQMTDSDWSVFEGDEYKSGPTDPTPKFKYYNPTHLLLSAVSWDHADLYPTEASYFKVFADLIEETDKKGMILACKDHDKVLALTSNARHLKTYGKDSASDYRYEDVVQTEKGLSFSIIHDAKKYQIESHMLGEFQAENITGCFAMAHEIGIPAEKIIEAIAAFKGLKRRLEKRLENPVTIFDDIAHSPEKATSVLKNIQQVYKGKIIAVFEPNIGGRKREAKEKYTNAFTDADEIIIPRLTKLKVSEDETEQPLEGAELRNIIAESHTTATFIENDDELVTHLVNATKKGDVIAFLGSHGFRGMIEATIEKLK